MATTMKAAQWDAVNEKVIVSTIPIPTPKEGEFLIRMGSASLCHSDLMAIATTDRAAIAGDIKTEPMTMGHEGAGYIEKLGPSTEGKGFAPGDAVGFLYIAGPCFDCAGCQVHNNYCTKKTPNTNGFGVPGFFAEYAVVDWQSCIKLPSGMDAETASPMFCAGITAFHCVDSCDLRPGEWLIVVGCGGLGQMAIQYAKAMGHKVIGVDINDAILANAKEQGADLIFNSRSNKSYRDEILKATGGGADAVAVFSAAQAAYDSATSLIKVGGLLMIVGLPSGGVTLEALDIVTGKYRVKGDSTGTPARMPKAIEFTAKHAIKPVIEIFDSLDDVAGMVDRMKKGESTKKMVVSFGKQR